MKIIRTILCVLVAASCLSACKGEEGKAESLMEQIRADYEAENYDRCLRGIDSLRVTYPKAVEARREALVLYKEASLHLAQQKLAAIDQRLQATETSYDSLSVIVADHRSKGLATGEELQALNEMKVLKDSLKGAFDVECAKIKYIHKKQKED